MLIEKSKIFCYNHQQRANNVLLQILKEMVLDPKHLNKSYPKDERQHYCLEKMEVGNFSKLTRTTKIENLFDIGN